jgi:hypothetical protein
MVCFAAPLEIVEIEKQLRIATMGDNVINIDRG